MTPDMFKITVSGTARAKADADFGHLPADARETVAGWLTAIEEVDARYSAASDLTGDMSFQTATAMLEKHQPMTLERYERIRREWLEARAPFTRGLTDLLMLYPGPPIFIPAARATELGLTA